MKIIFLDIDGVVNSMRTCIAFGGYPFNVGADLGQFDHVALALIRLFCKENGVKIVLSSTWRLNDKIFFEMSKALDLPIIDRTSALWGERNGKRGNEILIWLEKHPKVKQYAIIDDDSDMLEEQMPFFVKVKGYDGFSFENFKQLNSIFNPEDEDLKRYFKKGVINVSSGS